MTMILTIYVAISVTFSLGFVAGAWWASRARIDEGFEVATIDQNHEHAAVLVLGQRPTSMTFGKSVFW